MSTYVLVVLLSTLASLVALPVTGGFRISLAVVVLFSMIHALQLKRPILLAFVTGIAVVLTRIFVDSLSTPMTGTLASNYFLEVFFYLGYAVIYQWAIRNNTSSYPLPLVIALAIADTGGNFLEYSLRHLAADEAWASTSLMTILLAAIVRAVLIILLSWLISRFVSPKLGIERSRHD